MPLVALAPPRKTIIPQTQSAHTQEPPSLWREQPGSQVTLKLLEVPGVPSCTAQHPAQPWLQTMELAWPGGCTGKLRFKSIFLF